MLNQVADTAKQVEQDMDELVKRLIEIQDGAVPVEWTAGDEPETPAYIVEMYDNPPKRRKRQLNYAIDSEVEKLANGVFITKEGRPDFDNIRKMQARGFRVIRGEADSFSWLTGLIIVMLKRDEPVTVHLVFG